MKLICLIGMMGVGKDTLLDFICKNDTDITRYLSLTTRPMRTGEINGKEYQFVSEEEFNKANLMEKRVYKVANGDTWYYGFPEFSEDDISDNKKVYIIIVSGEGYDAIKEHYKDNNNIKIVSVYLTCNPLTRIVRALTRENPSEISEEDVKEICRRNLADLHDIEPYRNKCDYIMSTDSNKTLKVNFYTIEGIKNFA